MSELTQCNYCSLKNIRARAKKQGGRVRIIPSNKMKHLGGYEVHILANGEKPNSKNWVSWMMELTDHCVC